MKFGQPLLTTELSGSMGGAVASSARGGVGYFRVRARPGNPRTNAQTIMRSILTGIAAAWTSILTDLQRAAWAALAPSNSSGIDAYVKGNANRVLIGEPREDDAPPTLALPNVPLTVPPVVDASGHLITFTVPPGETLTLDYAVFISAQQHSSRLSQQFNFTFANAALGVTGGDVVNIAIPATHPAYNLTAGRVVYVRILAIGSDGQPGQVGTAQETRVVVVA